MPDTPRRRATKRELELRKKAYEQGVHDGQLGAFTMMAFVVHPELLEELLGGRVTALTESLRALRGDQAGDAAAPET